MFQFHNRQLLDQLSPLHKDTSIPQSSLTLLNFAHTNFIMRPIPIYANSPTQNLTNKVRNMKSFKSKDKDKKTKKKKMFIISLLFPQHISVNVA